LGFIPVRAASQTDSACAGVYLSFTDFINNKLTYAVNLNSPSESFSPPEIKKKLKIKLNDTTSFKLKDGSFYGYCFNGQRYRYYEAAFGYSGYFHVIDSGRLIIYSHPVHQSRYGSYLKYYYSMDFKSRIYELSFENIKVDFIDNPKFIEYVRNIRGLHLQAPNGTTKVNHLWSESLK
jgi:hypothetical protein